MDDLKLCDSDYAVMAIIWEHGPLSSRQLVEHCAGKLGWKKSTTYTVLKKLCDRGFAENRESIVTALVPQAQVQAFESQRVVDRTFAGSLPSFLAAFLGGKTISEEEAAQLKQMIDEHREV